VLSKPVFAHTNITELIIKGFYNVYNELGYGFLEKVYENAMVIALEELGLTGAQQVPIDVYFEGKIVGKYEADLVVDNLVIVELKAARTLNPDHEAQLLDYLKATRYEVGLLLNFGAKAEIKRKAFSNARKGSLSWTQSSPSPK
jgi:GxxExxY protein